MGFEWTPIRIEAAELIAARNLTYTEIAERLEIDRTTLWNWRNDAEFAARVEAITEEYRAETRRIGIADKEKRLAGLNDRRNRLLRVIEARADADEYQVAPGGSTGLLARTLKCLGSGDNATIVAEFAVDTGLLKELRELEKQAAVELGQWNEAPATEASKADELIRAFQSGYKAVVAAGPGDGPRGAGGD